MNILRVSKTVKPDRELSYDTVIGIAEGNPPINVLAKHIESRIGLSSKVRKHDEDTYRVTFTRLINWSEENKREVVEECKNFNSMFNTDFCPIRFINGEKEYDNDRFFYAEVIIQTSIIQ